jgi:hypothetical protein
MIHHQANIVVNVKKFSKKIPGNGLVLQAKA